MTAGSADTITDFQTGVDVIDFLDAPAADGTAGTGNYVELATIFTTYADAELAAKNAFAPSNTGNALVYVVTQVGTDSYLFVDEATQGNGDANAVVFLQGITLAGIAATDIV